MTETDTSTTPIPILTDVTAEKFREKLQPSRRPCVLRGLQLGTCVERWKDPEYLKSKCAKDQEVRIHVTNERNMDFKLKNFSYETCTMRDLLDKATSSTRTGTMYYLRHVGQGKDVRAGRPALLHEDFPDLAPDFTLPPLFDSERLFSSVLRVSSARLRVWTHYDVLDNVYVQVVGSKRAVLWAPDTALDMYLDGDKSRVVDIDAAENLDIFPKFCSAEKHTADLRPGDVLFIPAMWFHNMTAEDFGVAVNVFWRNLDASVYEKKDAYGNRDLVPAAKAIRMLDNCTRQLDSLPEELRDFYGRMLISRIERRCLSKPL